MRLWLLGLVERLMKIDKSCFSEDIGIKFDLSGFKKYGRRGSRESIYR